MVLIFQHLKSWQQLPIVKNNFKRKMWRKIKKIYMENDQRKIFKVWLSILLFVPSFSLWECFILINLHRITDVNISYPKKKKKKLLNLFSLRWVSPREWLFNGAKWLRPLCKRGGIEWQVELWRALPWAAGHPR